MTLAEQLARIEQLARTASRADALLAAKDACAMILEHAKAARESVAAAEAIRTTDPAAPYVVQVKHAQVLADELLGRDRALAECQAQLADTREERNRLRLKLEQVQQGVTLTATADPSQAPRLLARMSYLAGSQAAVLREVHSTMEASVLRIQEVAGADATDAESAAKAREELLDGLVRATFAAHASLVEHRAPSKPDDPIG